MKACFVSPSMDGSQMKAVRELVPGASFYSTGEMIFMMEVIGLIYSMRYLSKREYKEAVSGFPTKEQPFKSEYKRNLKRKQGSEEVAIIQAAEGIDIKEFTDMVFSIIDGMGKEVIPMLRLAGMNVVMVFDSIERLQQIQEDLSR